MNTIEEKRKILLGVTGSIAAYKSAEIAREFIKNGYHVKTVLTDSASKFIGSVTFEAITGEPVYTDFWGTTERKDIEHIALADWADVFLIAPASANAIAKLAYGMADNPLHAIALATKAKIVIAPAMNVNMWENPATQENLEKLKNRNIAIVNPEEGSLACGWNGAGRLAGKNEIFQATRRALSRHDFSDKKVLVIFGPTREAIDPVRYISNRSSGKMGIAISDDAFRRGAEVRVIHGPVRLDVPELYQAKSVVSADEMLDETLKVYEEWEPDVVVMLAAVSDYKPSDASVEKIKKSDGITTIDLAENQDILAKLGELKNKDKNTLLVGFALETGEIEDLLEEARNKLKKKNADLIVGNFAETSLGLDKNIVWLVNRTGTHEEVSTSSKSRVAEKILNAVLKLF